MVIKIPLNKKVLIELGKMALNGVAMRTCDSYYEQVTGLAMGSSLSPLLANAWLSRFDDISNSSNPRVYVR